jgi:putative FmdB family regulatory protein
MEQHIMPIYEYQCTTCGTLNEYLSKMGVTAEGLACKTCGAATLEKKLSVANVKVVHKTKGGQICDASCNQQSPACGSGDCPL